MVLQKNQSFYFFNLVYFLFLGCLVSLVISASFQPIGEPENPFNENNGSKVNHTYYHLFAQFGKNRFNFKPKPPKSGVTIQNTYNFIPQKHSEFPKISTRNSVPNIRKN